MTAPPVSIEARPPRLALKCGIALPTIKTATDAPAGRIGAAREAGMLNLSVTARSRDAVERVYLRLGRKLGHDLLAEVIRAPSLGPRLTLAKVGALAGAACVHLFTILLLVVGVLLIVRGWPLVVAVIGGALCLGIAGLLRPRLAQPDERLVGRGDAPALYALADGVARAMGAAPVHGLYIDGRFNASFGHYGLARRRIIGIGLPLLLLCTPQERVALLAHEVAHGVNGDPARSFFAGTAVDSLLTWCYLLRPDRIIPDEGGWLALGMIPINLVMAGAAQCLWWAASLLSHLLWRESQRAEYLADQLAASTAGPGAMAQLLATLAIGAVICDRTIRQVALSREDDRFFERLAAQMTGLDEGERGAIAAAAIDDDARLDATHPPTAHRLAFMRSLPPTVPAVILSSEDSARIDAELTALHGPIRRRILDAYRRSLEVASW